MKLSRNQQFQFLEEEEGVLGATFTFFLNLLMRSLRNRSWRKLKLKGYSIVESFASLKGSYTVSGVEEVEFSDFVWYKECRLGYAPLKCSEV